MSRLKFYVEKADMLFHFIWWRNWKLVRDEWNMTYGELEEARKNLPEIERKALERLTKTIEEQGEHEENPTTSAPSG